MRVLGLDHGERRIGAALSDEEGRIAQPHRNFERGADPQPAIDAIAREVEAQAVEVIVVGLPLRLDGSEGTAARRARSFATRLEAATGREVVLFDERLSTAAAERSLIEQGVDGRRRRGLVDRVAASLILQAYLDSKREGDDPWREANAADGPAAPAARGRRGRGGRSRGR